MKKISLLLVCTLLSLVCLANNETTTAREIMEDAQTGQASHARAIWICAIIAVVLIAFLVLFVHKSLRVIAKIKASSPKKHLYPFQPRW